jgi:hypothetical protein
MPFDLKADFEKFVDYYESSFRLFDQTLYDLCGNNPKHDKLDLINAKLWLIGRGLSSGVERHIKKKPGESALGKLAGHLLQHHKEVDLLICQLQGLKERLGLEALKTIVLAHGKFCSLVSRIAQKRQCGLSPPSIFITMRLSCRFSINLPMGKLAAVGKLGENGTRNLSKCSRPQREAMAITTGTCCASGSYTVNFGSFPIWQLCG